MGSFEDDLKEMFEGAEFQPTEQVWAGVEKALQQKRSRGIFFMWQTYGVAAGLALCLTAGWLYNTGFFNQGNNPELMKELTESLKEGEESKGIKDSTDRNTNEQPPSLLADKNEDNTDFKAKIPLNKEMSRLQLMANNNSSNGQLEEGSLTPNYASSVLSEEAGVNRAFGLIQRAPLKPYRPSLASARALWLKRLGVDNSALQANVAETIDVSAVPRGLSLNGRLGNNNLNMTSSPESLNAFGVEGAALSARADVSNQEEQALGAVSIGAGVTVDLSKKLNLNSSLNYGQFRVQSTSNAYSVENGKSLPIYLPIGFDPDNVNFVGNYNLINTLQSISIQTTVSYKMVQFGKFDLSFSAGAALDYFFSYTIKGELNFASVRKVNLSSTDYINKYNLSGVTGFGIHYKINDQFGLGADFSYRYFIPTQSQPEGRQTSVLGFGLGINYFLNRKEN